MKTKWMFCVGLVGCGLSAPQGPADLPADPWKRAEEQRLEEVAETCGGQPWERGWLCPRSAAEVDTTS